MITVEECGYELWVCWCMGALCYVVLTEMLKVLSKDEVLQKVNLYYYYFYILKIVLIDTLIYSLILNTK